MMTLKTKLFILILTNLLIENQCNDENQYPLDETKTDVILGGSDEEIIEEDLAVPKTEAEDTTAVIEEDRATTEVTTTIPANVTSSEEVSVEIEREAHEVVETATQDESVVTDGDDITLSLIDNNVYNTKDVDGYTNFTNNVDVPVQIDTAPTQATTRAMDDESLVPSAQDPEEDIDTSGQRNPKTENDAILPVEKRPVEAKPSPQPALSKSSTLKGWLEDSWVRPPAGILVPLRPMALNRALAVWNDLAVGGLNVSDIVVVGYDSNGVNWRSRHSLQPTNAGNGDRAVTEALSKLLLKYQGVDTDATNDGTMRALASAAKLVPYDSALFVVTDKGAGDPQRLPLALRALVEKRLKVYTIWTDPNHPSSDSEEALRELRNISQHTEGEVLPYSLQVMDLEGSSNLAAETELEQWEPLDAKVQGRRGRVNPDVDVDRFDRLLVRRGGGQAISLGVPVENGVSALRVFIEGAVEHAVLYPPNDAPQIDLYNATSVAAFSPASRTEGLMPREVFLVFPGAKFDLDMLSVLPANPATPDVQNALVGMWHLSVRCDTCDYRLCLSARSQLHFDVEPSSPDTLKFRVSGPVASVRESQLVDEYGVELAKLPFSYQPTTGDSQSEELDPIVELVADVAIPPTTASKVYVKIVGRDLRGEPYIRLAGPLNQPEVRMGRSASIVFPDSVNDLERAEEMNSRIYSSQQLRWNDSNSTPYSRAMAQVINQQGTLLTTVQIGLSTRLYGSPGDSLQLHFEVTNYREQSVRFTFGAVGELRFLTGINPTAQTVTSGQTVNVIVSVSIPSNAVVGARDLITFTAYGNEQVSISTYVYVANTAQTDVWAPELRHTFQGTCLGRTGSDCAQHTWATTIIARDALGGLLRLSSSPIGLIYSGNFIAGSRDEVVATYRATCCAPRILVTAVDAYGNANSYYIDISNYLNGAAIAAIVLGVLLAIALISLFIFLVYWCVRRRQESRELPSYNSRTIS